MNNPELDDSVVAGLGLMTQNCELELTSKDIVVGIYQNETFRKLTPDEVEQYFNNIQWLYCFIKVTFFNSKKIHW